MHEYLLQLHSLLNTDPSGLPTAWLLLVVCTGLIIGSYLNVVIYRGSAKYLGEEIKYKGKLDTCTPKHSFCPECLHPLSWKENIPVISWVVQGAKCKHCKCPIPIQYPAIEALNAITWAVLWKISPNIGEFFIYISFFSILLAVTVIDIKTLRIPNKIIIWGISIILTLTSIYNPSSLPKVLISALGAGALGVALVEIGKLLFGRKSVKLKTLTPFKLDQESKTLVIQEEGKTLDESEPMSTDELFARDSDTITIEGEIENIVPKKVNETHGLIIKKDEVSIRIKENDTNSTHIEKVSRQTTITGKIKEITIPQEALGMGDAKLLILIATGVGFPGFVHSLTLGAILGLVYALVLRIIAIARKGNAPSLIAFGPWLSLATLIVVAYNLLKTP
jgi:prepilin signal peptidase PulO-like enzyme (type II secretory pathway)